MANYRREIRDGVLDKLVARVSPKVIAGMYGCSEEYVRDVKKRCIETVYRIRHDLSDPDQLSFRFGRRNQYD